MSSLVRKSYLLAGTAEPGLTTYQGAWDSKRERKAWCRCCRHAQRQQWHSGAGVSVRSSCEPIL
eukprot:7486061-Pyramimonas_sp.AAC.1